MNWHTPPHRTSKLVLNLKLKIFDVKIPPEQSRHRNERDTMEKQDQEFLDKHLNGNRSLQALHHNIQDDMDKVEATLKIFTDSPNKIISEISNYQSRQHIPFPHLSVFLVVRTG